MKQKTMKQIVHELISKGHTISYYVRKDGGILIREIDGVRYTGAKGNIVARSLSHETLSVKRAKQLSSATKTKKLLREADTSVKEEWRRVKALWEQRFHQGTKARKKVGNLGWRGIHYAMKNYGREEALRRLSEAERYISGVAYSKNVELLIAFIIDYATKTGSDSLMKLATDIRNNAFAIREEWINPAYEALYKLNAGANPQDVASNLRKILRL